MLSSARHLVVLALASACFSDPPPSSDGSSSSGSATEQPTDAASEESAGDTDGDHCGCAEIGIAECDHYIVEYCSCIEMHAPESTKEAQLEAFAGTCEAWTEAAQGQGADALAEGCAAAVESVVQTAAGWGCDFDPLPGSCLGYCGSDVKVPDGDTSCYCDAECDSRKDCCLDFVDRCGEEAIEPEGTPVIELVPPAPETTLDPAEAMRTWPSIGSYPQLAPTLLAGLATGDDPLAVMGGLRDSFAATRWTSLDKWDRFGAIHPAVGFVTVRDGIKPQQGTSLGCLGGFVEAVRLLLAPQVEIGALLQPSAECQLLGDRPCDADMDTGLVVLANLQRQHLPDWHLDVASPRNADDLRALFDVSPTPYLVAASHRSRRDGVRRYHHMLVVLADADAPEKGPVVFDVTGLRGVSLRRVPWPRLHGYLGGSLAASRRFTYEPASAQVAVLTGAKDRAGLADDEVEPKITSIRDPTPAAPR